jgi:hypothetical protein|nr:hypothetical protein [Kofleriaceae bacterium]
MAKGARAPSHNAYRGSIGRTRSRAVHVTSPNGELIVYTATISIDAVADPDLVSRLHAGTLNVVEIDGGTTLAVPVPVIYHDPAAELLVLVLSDGDRHREIDERIRLLGELGADATQVPAYAKDFAVAFGPAGLAAYLEKRAKDALVVVEAQRDAARARAETERVRAEISELRAELERARSAPPTPAPLPPPEPAPLPPPVSARTPTTPPPGSLTAAPIPHVAAPVAHRDAPTQQISIAAAKVERTKHPLEGTKMQQVLGIALTEVTPDDLPPPPVVDLREHDHDHASRAAGDDRSTRREVRDREPNTHRVELIASDELSPDSDSESTHNGAAPVANGYAVGSAGTTANTATTVVSPVPAPPVSSAKVSPAAATVPGLEVAIAADAARRPPPGTSQVEIDDEQTAHSIVPAGADPLTSETVELPLAMPSGNDPWLELATTGASSSFTVDSGGARLALVAGEQIARGLGGQLDVRVLLYRLPTYPVVAIVLGPPVAFRAPSVSQLAAIPLDVGAQADRDLLGALSGGFELRIDIIKRGKLLRSVSVVAPLAENAGYVLRAAEDHLRGITADGSSPSFDRARDAILAPGYDILGADHPETAEFRDDKLAQLETAQQLRRAVAMARRFARPAREDYLVCTRGFPLARWHELRRHVVQSAVTWGIWMGPELAQVAVSEGFARSRRDLVVRLDAGFDALRRHPSAFDIDQDAADDNLAALAEEARALGVELRKSLPAKNGHIASDEQVAVAGSIEKTPTMAIPKGKSIDELIALLEDRNKRVLAALELCERGDARAAAPVIGVVQKLSRAEAVRVLGTSVRFGAAAAPALLAGLRSSKAFLRHGCALALAMLHTEDGTDAVIELLLSEPTEIWREIARAVGQVGPQALMPLAAQAGRLGEALTPAMAERVSWAMAHVAVRGGKAPLEALAGGHSVVAPIARKALELVETAATDHTLVRSKTGDGEARDVTVNRAFSRRFFEALDEGGAPPGAELSRPMETLDESDLISADDDEELDESDLIQS